MAAWDGADLSKVRPRFARTRALWGRPATWRKLHAGLTLVWLALMVPSLVWWRESIPWLIFISVWANVAGHFSAWQGSRAEANNGD